jgi:TPR repeat protein
MKYIILTLLSLSVLYSNNTDHQKSTKTIAEYEQECNNNYNENTCLTAASHYVTSDEEKTKQYLKKSCDAHKGAACDALACYAGELEPCVTAAQKLQHKKHLALSAHCYKLSCDKGIGSMCEALGDLYSDQLNDQFSAREFYEKAKEKNIQSGNLYYRLANMYENGIGGFPHIKRSFHLYTQACRYRSQKACTKLAQLQKEQLYVALNNGNTLNTVSNMSNTSNILTQEDEHTFEHKKRQDKSKHRKNNHTTQNKRYHPNRV